MKNTNASVWWPPDPDDVVRILYCNTCAAVAPEVTSPNPKTWMSPENARRGLGLPSGCSRTHHLRRTFIDLIDRGLVEGRIPCSRPQRGWEYRLTPKGVAYAKTI